jgi:hypothetical protein
MKSSNRTVIMRFVLVSETRRRYDVVDGVRPVRLRENSYT